MDKYRVLIEDHEGNFLYLNIRLTPVERHMFLELINRRSNGAARVEKGPRP